MNFYYHPILGLQYTFLGETILFDIANIPEDLDIKVFIKDFKKLMKTEKIKTCDKIFSFCTITNYQI